MREILEKYCIPLTYTTYKYNKMKLELNHFMFVDVKQNSKIVKIITTPSELEQFLIQT